MRWGRGQPCRPSRTSIDACLTHMAPRWGAAAQVVPKGDRLLVKVAQEEVKTRGGILLPPSAIKKPTSGGGSTGRDTYMHTHACVQSGLTTPVKSWV